MIQMLHSHFHNGLHVVVVQRIKHVFAFSPEFDQLGVFEICQLMG